MQEIIVHELGIEAFRETPLSALESKIFWNLVHTLPATGGVIITSKLSHELNLSYVRVNLGVKKLWELGFIIRGGKQARSYHYKLNPVYFKQTNGDPNE